MATIRGCLAASKLFNKSLKSRVIYTVTRSFASPQSDERVEMLRALVKRRHLLGDPKPVHRSTFIDWNYAAELVAFKARIGENFVGNTLEQALTQKSYVRKQELMNKQLGIDDPKRFLEDNQVLQEKGEELARSFVARYLRTALPCLPEEGIQKIRDHLLRDENLANIISNIGAEELILCTDFPTEEQTRVSTFYALIGAVEKSSGLERGALFVRDFVIASLSGQDIQALYMPENSFEILSELYLREGKEAPEPRLIARAGMNTLIPVYKVGLYSSKIYIGSGAGETVGIAVQHAAISVLWQLWGIPDGRFQFPYDIDVPTVLANSQSNTPQSEWTTDKVYQSTSVSS